MKEWFSARRMVRFWLPGAALLQLGGCLSDQQLTSIITSVVTTGLATLLNQFIVALFAGSTGAA
jgi:hypothetical protein